MNIQGIATMLLWLAALGGAVIVAATVVSRVGAKAKASL